MNVQFADNMHLRLIDVLCDILPRARRARMAVAFVKYSGLQLLDPFLDTCLTQGGNVEFTRLLRWDQGLAVLRVDIFAD